MKNPKETSDLARRMQATLDTGGKELWSRFLADAVLDRLPLHLSFRDELVAEMRARAEMANDPLTKAGIAEALRRIIAL